MDLPWSGGRREGGGGGADCAKVIMTMAIKSYRCHQIE